MTDKLSRLYECDAENLTGGRYAYRCNKCGEIDWGNGDHDKRHMEWRRKHWSECWDMAIKY
jgi:hypothetical protein